MNKASLLAEVSHEADNTRKLFDAIPDSALSYKPNDFNWSIAQLASHTAEVYNWMVPTLESELMDLEQYRYDKGDIGNMASIRAKLEENIRAAETCIKNLADEKISGTWSMVMGEKVLMPPMPKAQVVRSFLLNHLYHHRGELVAYLRASGNKVPGLYGASFEEQQAMQQA
jgi:uncharacterized damage-inducible protein DinB